MQPHLAYSSEELQRQVDCFIPIKVVTQGPSHDLKSEDFFKVKNIFLVHFE